LTPGRAAWNGALSGALPGVLFGWLFGLFSWADALVATVRPALHGLIIGALLGAIMGLIVYGLQRGRRELASVPTMRLTWFKVVADDEVADEGVRLLGRGG
jgi:hypothetical protein